jgi:hypothetical protein
MLANTFNLNQHDANVDEDVDFEIEKNIEE